MKTNRSLTVIILLTCILFSSCISLKKYKSISGDLDTCKRERADLKQKYSELLDAGKQQESAFRKTMTENRHLKEDTARLNNDKRILVQNNAILRRDYDFLRETFLKLKKGNETEMASVLNSLQKNQERLLANEDKMKDVSKDLDDKEKKLKELQLKFDEKQKKILELQSILNKKDSVVKALKKTVNDALLGFVGQGLSVNIRNGKVYVSLEESLLFATASWQVSSRGIDALKKLAKVLETNQEINVLVEGHTDDVPFNGVSQVKDNWDLSVMRATSVVKIILSNGSIKPERLEAAGHSEYIPVEKGKSAAARAKNRRTEIILTPKLDELFQIIEAN